MQYLKKVTQIGNDIIINFRLITVNLKVAYEVKMSVFYETLKESIGHNFLLSLSDIDQLNAKIFTRDYVNNLTTAQMAEKAK